MRCIAVFVLLFASHAMHGQTKADSAFVPKVICPDCTDTAVASSLHVSLGDVALFHMVVYNRWGQKVFDSRDKSVSWNGKLNNTGENCNSGVYMYTLNYMPAKGSSNDYREVKGSVTLQWKK